ncbi:hypothetical protein [Aquimarina amphilecti]|nr:hypothetical protein [Aquimarina amphilecti]
MFRLSWSQHCEYKTRIIEDELQGRYEFIDSAAYEKHKKIAEKFIDFTPANEQKIITTYPKTFKLNDSCYTFNKKFTYSTTNYRRILKACNINGSVPKESLGYQFKGIYFNHVLIEVSGYEHWGYLSVDLENEETLYTLGKPLSSKGKTAISYSNYYSEEEITITDLKINKQYTIGIEDLVTAESYVIKDVYYLKLTSNMRPNCYKKIKYLKLQLTDQ